MTAAAPIALSCSIMADDKPPANPTPPAPHPEPPRPRPRVPFRPPPPRMPRRDFVRKNRPLAPKRGR
jgi:hypothetical protein